MIIGDYQLPYCTITGTFVAVDADTADEDPFPDVQPLNGTITLTPTTNAGRVEDAFAQILPVTVRVFGGQIVDDEDVPGVRILATDANIGVADWAWRASFKFDSLSLDPLTFKAPRDTTVNLTSGLVPIKSQPYQIVEGASIVDAEEDGAGKIRFALSDGTFTRWIDIPNGEKGEKGAVPTASDYLVVGPGRPDAPTTTGLSSAQIAALPVGCEYRSTDGASVGAWVWRKRPMGWTVTDGDTGWCAVTDAGVFQSGGILVRRTTTSLTIKVGTGAYGLFSWASTFANNASMENILPVGFRPDATSVYVTARTDHPAKSVVGAIEFETSGVIARRTTQASGLTSDALSIPISTAWPFTLPGTPA